MRTSALAVLWESWRLSRLHLAVMAFVATFGGAALIASPMDAAESVTWALMLAGYVAFISTAWAGNIDNRKGFSLTLGFTRPIPTWVLVSVPMAYVGITCAASYLVPVLILRMAFGVAFPLLQVAALLATLSLVGLATNWATRKSAVRFVIPGLIALAIMWYSTTLAAGNVLAPDRWPELFSFSAWAYVFGWHWSPLPRSAGRSRVSRGSGTAMTIPREKFVPRPVRLRGDCPSRSPGSRLSSSCRAPYHPQLSRNSGTRREPEALTCSAWGS